MSRHGRRRLVVLSNRGPVAWRRDEAGTLVGRRGAGGLVSAIAPALESAGGTWIAAAMSDADRACLLDESAGYRVRLLDLPEGDFHGYRETVSDGFLWSAHHDLWDRARTPVVDSAAHEAWEAYRRINAAFCDAALDEVGDGDAIVAVQDYHLSLVPAMLKRARPDLAVLHFSHTPFGTIESLRVLPGSWLHELAAGMVAADVCGFHTRRWAERFGRAAGRWAQDAAPRVDVFPLGPDPESLRAQAFTPEVDAELAALDADLAGRRCLLRVDRAELSKNILRGLLAYDELLLGRPDLVATTAHVVLLNPSRQYEAYRRYLDECVALAGEVNARHGGDSVILHVEDRFPRSLAAYRRADVVVVNPISDGMNLVAKETALVNEADAVLVLSTEAGAHEGLQGACESVDPYDVSATASAMERALDMARGERAALAAELRRRSAADPPAGWLSAQLDALGVGLP